jgi:hypothetical protein
VNSGQMPCICAVASTPRSSRATWTSLAVSSKWTKHTLAMFALEALEAERILSKPGEGTLVRMHRRASRVLEAFIDESVRVSVRAQHHPTIFQGMRYRHGTWKPSSA